MQTKEMFIFSKNTVKWWKL